MHAREVIDSRSRINIYFFHLIDFWASILAATIKIFPSMKYILINFLSNYRRNINNGNKNVIGKNRAKFKNR